MSQGQAGGFDRAGRTARLLPAEIGFLVDHGHAADTLYLAAAIAAITATSPDEALLKCGFVGEEEFYRALARELRLTFLPRPPLAPDCAFPLSIAGGIAPLRGDGARFVFAPRAAQLSRLLRSRHSFERHLAITSPSALRRAVFRTLPRQIAYRAVRQLPDAAPHLSSREVMAPWQALLLGGLSAFGAGSLALFPLLAATLLGAALTPLFLATVLLRLRAATSPSAVSSHKPSRRADAELPTYTVIAALYRERRVAARLLEALRQLDYPAVKLDIKLVLEADDRETPAALSAIPIPPHVEILVAPPGEPKTKPRALNVALPLARGEFTVVYDAEDIPDPDQLRLAAATFAKQPPEVACLQARLTIENSADSWLTRLFTLDYAALFDALNPGLAALGSPLPLGGSSNHFRTDTLRRIMGWDAWNVTEDADLGIRLARFGYRVGDLRSSTYEEAPLTVGAWMRQRTRWMKGYMQTSLVHSRQPLACLRQLGAARFAAAMALTLGTVLSALVYPFFTVLSLFVLGGAFPGPEHAPLVALWTIGSTLFFLLGSIAILVPALLGLRRRGLWGHLPWVALLPFYCGMISAAAWRAVWELARDPFRWNKTDHGFARSSRRVPVRPAPGGPARPPPGAG